MGKLEDGKEILKALGLPLQQQTDIASYTLLALAGIGKRTPWTSAKRPSRQIHAIKEWVRETPKALAGISCSCVATSCGYESVPSSRSSN
jgi:hypothetical protein